MRPCFCAGAGNRIGLTEGEEMSLSITVMRRTVTSAASFVALVALTPMASAQLTSAQQSALRANCTSDFQAKCSSEAPGSKGALTCLQRNVAALSPACKTAVSSTMPAAAPPAPVAAKSAAPAVKLTAAQQSAMKQNCRNDFMSHCAGVTPGGKDAIVCLQRNVASLSPGCQRVVSTTLPAAAPPPAPASAAIAATPAAGPTPQQMSAIKRTCRVDFKVHCSGVPQGGPEALVCLQRNGPRLTPDCRTSLAAIADVMPDAAPPAAVPVAAPVAAPARPLPPGITPAGRILRRVIKREREHELER
jgi:hypothetical protein